MSTPRKELDKMELCSDRFVRQHPEHQIDTRGRAIGRRNTPTLNWEYLRDLLLSKDLSRIDELDFANKDKCRFLDRKIDMKGKGVMLTSFPGSDIKQVRRFFQKVTGVFTGSDMDLNLVP